LLSICQYLFVLGILLFNRLILVHIAVNRAVLQAECAQDIQRQFGEFKVFGMPEQALKLVNTDNLGISDE
jgi:hypothetical protein